MAVASAPPPLLEARDISVVARGRTILEPTSLRMERGDFVAVIGESGAGKTTLIKALTGVTTPSLGVASIDGEIVQRHRRELAYVPQDDIVHPSLTVGEALRCAAALRLPRGTARADRDDAIRGVLRELTLEDRVDSRIDRLSGGQRKRVNVASELLTRPKLLCLDEPTTGLDALLERRTMLHLRDIADRGRGVIVVTHATSSLDLVDKLVVMGRGGRVCFDGRTSAALDFFGVEDASQIYAALDAEDSDTWARRFARLPARSSPAEAPTAPPSTTGSAAPSRRVGPLRQLRTLTFRYARLFARDRRNLLIVFGQVPVIGAAIVGLFKANALEKVGGRPGDAAQLLFMLVTAALWFGSIGAAREIVKERAVYLREAAVGVWPTVYLVSKLVVLFLVVALQVALLAAIVFAARPLREPPDVTAQVVGLLVATGFVAVALGLGISAAVSTEEQATSLLPLVLIPQLLFGGAIVPVAAMSAPMAAISSLAFAQWSFAGVGTALAMNGRIAADRAFAEINRFGTAFFSVELRTALAVLGAFLAVFLLTAWVLLRIRGE